MTEASVLRLIVSLVFIIALILFFAWVTRKSGWLRGGNPQIIRMLGSQSLGGRNYITMVEVEDARLVLGVTPQQISLLHTLPPSPPDSTAAGATSAPTPGNFSSALRTVLKRQA